MDWRTAVTSTAGDPPTSLALYGDRPQPERCPRKEGYVLVSESTGQIVAASCDANFCEVCAPRKAWKIGRAISLSTPERAVRLSALPVEAGWQGVRRSVSRLTEYVRKDGYEWHIAYHVEWNPSGNGMAHAHGWQYGDYVPQARLQELCEKAGQGIPYIQRMRQRVGRGQNVSYGLKGVTYGLKGAYERESLDGFLEANGGRLVHSTRGFWRDGRGGETLTLEEAKKRASPESEDPGPWSLMSEALVGAGRS